MPGRVKVFWFPMAIVMLVALRVRSRNRVQSMTMIFIEASAQLPSSKIQSIDISCSPTVATATSSGVTVTEVTS